MHAAFILMAQKLTRREFRTILRGVDRLEWRYVLLK